jgi:serine/threonine protein kinase
MGVVYRAIDARLGRKVALKVLPAEYGEDETFRANFLRESRLAASIEHRGVIPIYEALIRATTGCSYSVAPSWDMVLRQVKRRFLAAK